MKKIALLLTALLTFAVSSFAMREPVSEEQIPSVISEFYPNLAGYYEEGLIEIASLTEEELFSGDLEYNIRYKFVNAYCKDEEIPQILEKEYPNEFILYKAGLLKDVSIFKYVDRENGKIETHLSYNWMLPTHRRMRGGRHIFRF